MNLYDSFQNDAELVVQSVEESYAGRPKAMLKALLGQSYKLEYNSPWYWWVVNAVKLSLSDHEREAISDYGPQVNLNVFIDSMNLSPARKDRLYRIVRALIESASLPRQGEDRCTEEDLDMAMHMAWGFVHQDDFPWVALMRIASRKAGMTPQNSVDAYHIMSEAGEAMIIYFECHALPEIAFIDLCVCLNIHSPTPSVMCMLSKSCAPAHALTRDDLLREHNILLYWNLAHTLMDGASVDACTRDLVLLVVFQVAHFLMARGIYLFRFAMHRLTELICGPLCSDHVRVLLRRVICTGLKRHQVQFERFFGWIASTSTERAYWEVALGGPAFFESLISELKPTQEKPKGCEITSMAIYHEINLPAGSDTVSVDMETLVRHMTINRQTNPLTNETFTRKGLATVTGDLIAKFSGTRDI